MASIINMESLLARGRHRISKAIFQKKFIVPSKDDYYLVSYPRSGNTWMRVLVSEILYGKSGNSIADLQYYVPDLHNPITVIKPLNSNFRVFKSHFQNCHLSETGDSNRYRNVIYIVRDPRDVALSYYRYLLNFGVEKCSFDDFLIDWLNGRIWPCSWQEHVNSWTNLRDDSTLNICVLRYEDLLSNPQKELLKVCDFVGILANHDRIENAILNASVEKMKSKAKKQMPKNEQSDTQVFIGKASSLQWKDNITDEQNELISSYCSQTMKRYKYK